MHAWNRPPIESLPGRGHVPLIWDTATRQLRPSAQPDQPGASLYVCGITPYDSTHLGHAATYLAFDLLIRAWLDARRTVRFAQCVTEVDDPLLERAAATGVNWANLAADQIDLFRNDMEALAVIPPDYYRGVEEQIPAIVAAVTTLEQRGWVYRLPAPDGGEDLYADLSLDPNFGSVSGLTRATMIELFGQRGGDPDRPGKRGQLDPLLWRARRPGEPSWPTSLGAGRPGWHIECGVIALEYCCSPLDGQSDRCLPLDVQGGGSDLIFPHHEMSSSHLRGLANSPEPVAVHMNTGLIGLNGTKMSKSLGNLVFVSQLRQSGVDPMAVRLALISQHYRTDRDWTDQHLADAETRLDNWRSALAGGELASTPDAAAVDQSVAPPDTATQALINQLRRALALDLDSPAAIAAIDQYVTTRPTHQANIGQVKIAIGTLLGISL